MLCRFFESCRHTYFLRLSQVTHLFHLFKTPFSPLERYDRVGEGMQEMQDMPFRCEILSNFFNFFFSITSVLATNYVYKISKGWVQLLESYDRVGKDVGARSYLISLVFFFNHLDSTLPPIFEMYHPFSNHTALFSAILPISTFHPFFNLMAWQHREACCYMY